MMPECLLKEEKVQVVANANDHTEYKPLNTMLWLLWLLLRQRIAPSQNCQGLYVDI